MTSNDSDHVKVQKRREEKGWVLIATLVFTTIAASITVGWARHAVLSKGQLDFATGASRTEEASRSGFDRTREQMRRGQAPGSEEDGEDETVVTEDGDKVRVSHSNNGHNGRNLDIHVENGQGGDHRDAALSGSAEIVPGSQGGGKRTRFTCTKGSQIILIPGLNMITGEMVFTPSSDLTGVFLLEDGARMVLEDCTLVGSIVTRASLCEDNALSTGANRPTIEIHGGFTCRPGSDLPGMAICGPDAVLIADGDARIDIAGMIVVDEIDLPCRGTLRGMVISEGSESFGSLIVQPGNGRGPQDFPDFVEVGSERMTRIAFPAEGFTSEELDAIEAYDVLADL